MDIQSLKINFIQEFLRLKNEQTVNTLIQVLRQEKKKLYESEMKAMSHNEFNSIISQAENDAREGRVKDAKELKNDIKSW